MNILLDTNVLCGLFDDKNVHHEQACRLLLGSEGASVLIPFIVMAELLMDDVDSGILLQDCKKLCGSFLAATEKELRILGGFPSTLKRTLKANDCLILAFAKSHSASLFTFDRTLQKAYEKIV